MNPSASLALDEAHRRGIRLTVEHPDRLRFTAPPGAMTPALAEALKAHKPDVIRLLTHPPRASQPSGNPGQRQRRSRPADPEALRLLSWFKEAVADLPREPFRLAPCILVADPAKFFARLQVEGDAYPNGDRPEGMAADLLLLKAVVDARPGKGRPA